MHYRSGDLKASRLEDGPEWAYPLKRRRGFTAGWYMLTVSADVLLIGRNLALYSDFAGNSDASDKSGSDSSSKANAPELIANMRLGAHSASKRLFHIDNSGAELFAAIENADPSHTSPDITITRVTDAFAKSRMLQKLQYAGSLPTSLKVSEAEDYLASKPYFRDQTHRLGYLFGSYLRLLERHVRPLEYAEWLDNKSESHLSSEPECGNGYMPTEAESFPSSELPGSQSHLNSTQVDSVPSTGDANPTITWTIIANELSSDFSNIAEALQILSLQPLSGNISVNLLCCCQDDAPLDAAAARLQDSLKIVNHKKPLTSDSLKMLVSQYPADYVVFLGDEVILCPDAFSILLKSLQTEQRPDLVYCDHDVLDHNGDRIKPVFKPEWNPELLLNGNYIGRFFALSGALFDKCGGLNASMGRSMHYDVLLRCIHFLDRPQYDLRSAQTTEQSHGYSSENFRATRIPQVLYHLDSVDLTEPYWMSVEDRDVLALDSHLREEARRVAEQNPHALVPDEWQLVDGLLQRSFKINRDFGETEPSVDIVIPTRDKVEILKTCVDSVLRQTGYRNFRILIVDNGSVEQETHNYYREIYHNPQISLLKYDGVFNYSAINNYAVSKSRADVIVLLNNDTEVKSEQWLHELVSHAVRPEVGCVGAKLYYSNGLIQHAGVILGIKGVAGHSHRLSGHDDDGYCGRLKYSQNVTAVTAACLALRRSVFNEVNGLDEVNLQVAYNDVDLCLRVLEAGYCNIWTPFAELYHHESLSRGADDTPEKARRFRSEYGYMQSHWQTHLRPDPAYNPNLALDQEDFSLAA